MPKLGNVVKSLQTIDTGVFDTTSVKQLSAAIDGLTLKQAQVALSTKKLTQEQAKQVLVEAGLIASEDKIQAELVQTALAQAGLSAAKQNTILDKLNLIDTDTKEIISTNSCTKAKLLNALATQNITGANAEAIMSSLGFTSANTKLTTSFTGLAASIWASTKALLKFLFTTPAGWAVTAVTAIVGVTAAIENYEKAQEEAFENAIETVKKYKDTIADIQSESKETAKTAAELAPAYAKLVQGIDTSTNRNISLTNKEYEEFLDLNNQLAELFPSLTKNYDENGNAILGLSGSIESVTGKIAALVEQQEHLSNIELQRNLKFYVNGDDDSDGQLTVLEGLEDNVSDAQKALDKLQTEYDTILKGQKGNYLANQAMVSAAESYYMETFGFTAQELKDILIPLDSAGNELTEKELEDIQPAGYVFDFSNLQLDETRKNAILDSYNSFFKDLSSEYEYAQTELAASNKEMSSMMMLWVEEEAFYKNSEESLQTLIRTMVGGVDWNTLDLKDFAKAQTWVTDNIFKEINSIGANEKAEITDALNQLFALNFSEMPIKEAHKQIQNYIGIIADILGQETADRLKISFGFEEYDNLAGNYEHTLHNAVRKVVPITDKNGDRTEYNEIYNKIDEFAIENSINTQNEIAAFQDALEKSNYDIDRAFSYYLDEKEKESRIAFSDKLITAKESLDTFTSSVQSASDAYATLMNPNISSTDILSSIMTINDAISAMNGSLNWELIAGQTNSLEQLGNTIEYISEQYAKSILSNAGIAVESDFGKMLANNIIQAQKASTQLETLNNQLNSLQSAYDSLTDIIETYNDTGQLSFDQLQTILSLEPQYLSCLISENGQLLLNEQAMIAIAEQRLNEAEAQAIQQAIVELGTLTIQSETAAVAENTKAFASEISILNGYNQTLATTIARTGISNALIRDLNAAIIGAEEQGADDTQISTVLGNLDTKLQLIDGARSKLYADSLSPSAEVDTSRAETDWKSFLDKEITLLEKQLDAGLITFREYLDKRSTLLDDYYTAGKITAEDYYDGLSSLYESQLSTYDKVIGAVTNRIDKEIDSLEKQKEVIAESYRFKMDAVQAQIDALNKENEARKEQISLEQAQYEAERARNQRSVKQFVNGQFVYTSDMDEVKAAEENLAEQEQQMEISRLEDQITALETEMENATASLDNQIDALEAYKEQWSEISSVYEEQQNALITAEILGADWEAQVLSGRLATLQEFTHQYIALQQAQANAAAQAAQVTQSTTGDSTGGRVPQVTSSLTAIGSATEKVFSQAASTLTSISQKTSQTLLNSKFKTTVPRYHDGLASGYVGEPNKMDERIKLLLAATGDHLTPGEVPAILKQGELVLTSSQQDNLAATLMRNSMDYGSLAMQDYVAGGFDFSKLPGTTQSVVQNINLTLPNITNQTGYENLRKELHQMQIDARQRAYRH